MAPENEGRPRAVLYDHESEQPRRRPRPAADWGVGEHIFDRMPNRRFSRADRRAEHQQTTRRADAERPRGAESWGYAWAEESPRASAAREAAATRSDERVALR